MERMKAAHALLSHYEKLFKLRYGKGPSLNRYREKYAMADVIDSVGYERGRELVEYYFKTSRPGHPLQFFFYNFDRMDEVMKGYDKDKIRQEKLLEQTAKRVKERKQSEFGSEINIGSVQE